MTFVAQTIPLQQSSWSSHFYLLGIKCSCIFHEIVARHGMKAKLGKLSAKNLRDIGLTRDDVALVDHLPYSSSGALELAQTGSSRAGNW